MTDQTAPSLLHVVEAFFDALEAGDLGAKGSQLHSIAAQLDLAANDRFTADATLTQNTPEFNAESSGVMLSQPVSDDHDHELN